ncbi:MULTISPECIES: hypothetical protein [unclassified Clostridium]|uniref:hypothetical protein n=1 Tax=unclassified Clostridium TaxID=2614128 RepID=UPI000297B8AC|nr:MULTISPECIES: hypothetical protein [unclassified Clostridium]EKQ56645.1 MAG: hypothetical protein A370_01720 [Clostridium sp. Maddingley MBC34-26]
MIDNKKEINKELGKTEEVNEFQEDLTKNIDTILAYGPYKLGLANIDRENSAEKRIKEDLKK